jgi:hypothetical protein
LSSRRDLLFAFAVVFVFAVAVAFAFAFVLAFAFVFALAFAVILSEAKNPRICLSRRSEATYQSKINLKILQKIDSRKTASHPTIFTTQSTTSKPQNHHAHHPLFPKPPAKTPIHHKQKKTAQPKPSRLSSSKKNYTAA